MYLFRDVVWCSECTDNIKRKSQPRQMFVNNEKTPATVRQCFLCQLWVHEFCQVPRSGPFTCVKCGPPQT